MATNQDVVLELSSKPVNRVPVKIDGELIGYIRDIAELRGAELVLLETMIAELDGLQGKAGITPREAEHADALVTRLLGIMLLTDDPAKLEQMDGALQAQVVDFFITRHRGRLVLRKLARDMPESELRRLVSSRMSSVSTVATPQAGSASPSGSSASTPRRSPGSRRKTS